MIDKKRTRPLSDFGIEIFIQQCIHPKPKPIREVRDLPGISKILLEHIKTHCIFQRSRIPNHIESDRENAGVLRCNFRLSEIKKLCGGCLDEEIFRAIDSLIESGKIIILYAGIRKYGMSHLDILFVAEFAQCEKSHPPHETYNILRFYPAEPLSKAAIKKRSAIIPNISEHVRKIRAKRDRIFKERFGDRSGESKIEREIDREAAKVRAEEHKAIMSLANLGEKTEVSEQSETKV